MEITVDQALDQPSKAVGRGINDDIGVASGAWLSVIGARQGSRDHVGDSGAIEASDDV